MNKYDDHLFWSDIYDEPKPDNYAKEFFEGLLESIYETGDISEMQNCLDELCSVYDVKMPESKPMIEKKDANRQLHWYLGYQRATLEMMGVKNV